MLIIMDIFAGVSKCFHADINSEYQAQIVLFDSAAKCIYWPEASKRKW